MSDLDATAEAALRVAGWYPGRKVDIGRYRESWTLRNIFPNEPAKRFCAEFGGLTILHAPRIVIGNDEHRNFTKFDPVYAVDGTADRAIAEFSFIAGEPLCPVGTNRSHMTLFVAEAGRVLAGVDNYLFLLGGDFYTALNQVCSGEAPELIGEWHPAQTDGKR